MRRTPTLEQIERRPDGPQTRPRPVTDTGFREARLPVIGSWSCWCGRRSGHGWPGKNAGAPHPGRGGDAQCAMTQCR